METCKKILISGLESLNLSVAEDKVEQLLGFIKLLEKWNKAYNLTSIRDREDMVRLHLLDSLAILPFIEGKRVIDIGTGAGLPGIPLFVQQAILELKLKNVSVCHNRVEQYHPDKKFDTVITRAFAGLSDIVELTAHLLSKNGVLLAMKGQSPDVPKLESAITTLIPVNVPGITAERCLVRIQLTKESEVS
jgi:16S rRNA (guanine527-N7)-methyltransferase